MTQGVRLPTNFLSPAALSRADRLSLAVAAADRASRARADDEVMDDADGVRIVQNKLLGGWFVVRGPHQTPISGRFDSKEAAQAWLDSRK